MVFQAAVRSAGRIGQRVLVASLFRNSGVQLLHRLALHSIVDIASRIVRVFGKAFESSFEIGAAHANSVNGNVVAEQFLQHGVVVIHIELWPVDAVGNQKNNLPALALWITVFQQLGCGVDRIVQCLGRLALEIRQTSGDIRRITDGGMSVNRRVIGDGRARRSRGGGAVQARSLQFRKQLVLVAEEAFARVKALVEAANPGFISQTQSGNNRAETWLYLPGVPGIQVVINQHNHGDGNRLGNKGSDFLLDVILEDAKFIPAKGGNEPAGSIFNGDWDDALVNRNADGGWTALLSGG